MNIDIEDDDEYYFDDRMCSYPCEYCGEIDYDDDNDDDE